MIRTRVFRARDAATYTLAAATLRKGGLVAFRTETVYGLGADALNPKAVAKIFKAKKRPYFDPLIVHVSSLEEALKLWKAPSQILLKLAKRYWPGPLTLVYPKNSLVPDIVTAGMPTVAVRVPSDPSALKLLRAFSGPIAAPSANTFGHTSPTTAKAVLEDLDGRIDIVVDAGHCQKGVESTIVQVQHKKVSRLRPGPITAQQLQKIAKLKIPASYQGKTLAPGMLKSHYAPYTPLVLENVPVSKIAGDLRREYRKAQKNKLAWPKLCLFTWHPLKMPSSITQVIRPGKSGDSVRVAVSLFDTLRTIDKMGFDMIVVGGLKRGALWDAISDRLIKASGGKTNIHQRICQWQEKNKRERS